MSASWLQTLGRDGNRHVLYLPELRRHQLTVACHCEPEVTVHVGLTVRVAVITHKVITRAFCPPRREREH